MKWLVRSALPAILLASCGGAVGTPLPAASTNTPTFVAKSNDASGYELTCGVLSENTITSGQGSGPNTFELRPATSARTGSFGGTRLGGWIVDRPAIGTYVCVTLSPGAPMGGFRSQVRAGEPGYIAEILPNGFALPQSCAYVGQATSGVDGLSVVWTVDCGAMANRSVRATLAPGFAQQGWVSCAGGLAVAIWSKDRSRLLIAEGSGAPGEYPMMTQRLSLTGGGCP